MPCWTTAATTMTICSATMTCESVKAGSSVWCCECCATVHGPNKRVCGLKSTCISLHALQAQPLVGQRVCVCVCTHTHTVCTLYLTQAASSYRSKHWTARRYIMWQCSSAAPALRVRFAGGATCSCDSIDVVVSGHSYRGRRHTVFFLESRRSRSGTCLRGVTHTQQQWVTSLPLAVTRRRRTGGAVARSHNDTPRWLRVGCGNDCTECGTHVHNRKAAE